MKKCNLFLLFFICGVASLFAQNTTTVEPAIYAWRISDRLGVVSPSHIDTAVVNFQDDNPIDRYSIANAYNGNLGSPLQSKIYFDRTAKSDFLFSRPYDAYFTSPSDVLFINTKIPYVNLTYITGGPTEKEEDDLKALLSMNINKRFNISGFVDFMNAPGLYNQQSSGQLKGGFFGSYVGKHYSAHGILSSNNFNNFENGGIADDNYIINPSITGQYIPENIPVKITDAASNYQNNYLYYNQKYSLGFEKEIKISTDSTILQYIPVTTFAHSLKLEDDYKRYVEKTIPAGFYTNNYLSSTATNDSVRYMLLRNTVSVSLNEEYNRLLRFGLTAFVEHDLNRYFYMNGTLPTVAFENNLRVGGELSKRKGSVFTYNIGGDFVVLGDDFADFNLYVGANSSLPLGKSRLMLTADASEKNITPSFFEQNYSSNHFVWANTFDKSLYSTLTGKASLDLRFMQLGIGLRFQDIGKYVYFDTNALPAQFGQNIQVFAGNAEVNFKLGRFFLENKLVYQNSSHPSILPLPELSSFHNFYYQQKWFKELTVQLGVNLYYHTSYYAPTYMPATGQFYLQNDVLIGNYPMASVYANFHLKRTRFFIKYYHFNKDFSNLNYFSMAHYPLNPSMLKLGISWNFND